jgi:hypothetical protein
MVQAVKRGHFIRRGITIDEQCITGQRQYNEVAKDKAAYLAT